MTFLAHEKEIVRYQKTLEQLKEENRTHALLGPEEIGTMEKKLEQLKARVYSQLKPWDRIAICRHPKRPHALDYIEALSEEFVELAGDRTFGDDHSIIAALARIDGERFLFIGQEKGKDTESRLFCNFGMPHPEGYRKALRCMQMAAKFSIPIVTLIDTPGAYPGLAAEERGQGWAIAKNLLEMARLPVPVIVIIIGEGNSGGALGIGIGDVIAILEHSYYSVISPEGCASILWKDPSKNELAASCLKMHAESLLELGIVDQMICEPPGGAHTDPRAVFHAVKQFIISQSKQLQQIPAQILLENRYQKFRKMGKFRCDETSSSSRAPQ